MKIKYVLPLLAVTVLAGCSHFKVAGTDFDNYIQKNGAPTSEYTMQNGNKLYTYKTLCPNNKNWQEYTVEVSPDNIIVNRKYIKNCVYWSELDSYIQKHGVPTGEYEMQNGNKLYIYKSLCADRITWQEYNIEVNPQNNIVKKTDVRSCPDPMEEKRKALQSEYHSAQEATKKAYNEWQNSSKTKGSSNLETLDLFSKYHELFEKEREIEKEYFALIK